MATSGTYSFNMTAADFLDSVLRLAGVLDESGSANAKQYNIANEALQLQLHQLEVNDVPLWKFDFFDFKPVQSDYVLHNSNNYRCVTGHTSDSTTEPGVGDLWQTFWVLDIDPEGTPSAWLTATDYITSIEISVPDRFYDILTVTTLQNSSNEIDVEVIPFSSYTAFLNSKRTALVASVPLYISFDNKLDNTCYIYPQPTNTFDSTMRMYGILKPEDVSGGGQTLDIPPRYLNMLRFNVALDVAFTYSRDAETMSLLTRQASYYTDKYKKSNVEHVSSNIIKGAY